MANITLFAQAIGKLPKENIRKIIRQAKTDKHCKGYSTWSQFISMMFCQFSGCDSVRDISNGLNSANGNLNHLSISHAPSKSTVAYQNAHRDSGVFREIFYEMYRYFGQQAQWERGKFRFKMPIKLLDSSTVTLTMSLYEWAHYTTKKGAVKMHTLLDYDSLLPEFVNITDGKCGDNKAAFDIPVTPHSVVVADHGYCDFALLNDWDSNNVFFVVRHKDNLLYSQIKELDLPEKRAQNVLIDEIIELLVCIGMIIGFLTTKQRLFIEKCKKCLESLFEKCIFAIAFYIEKCCFATLKIIEKRIYHAVQKDRKLY